MRTAIALIVAATLAAATMPIKAHAENGQITAGVLGGLAAGALLGSAMSAPRPYYAPAPVYVAPPPAYVEPVAPACYWSPGEPVWDDYTGTWVRPRVRVCY